MFKKVVGTTALIFAFSVGIVNVFAAAREQQNGETMMTMKKQDNMKTANSKKTVKKRRTSKNAKRAKKSVKQPSNDSMTGDTMTDSRMEKP